MLSELQRQFAGALVDPGSRPPIGAGRAGSADEQMFAIHRNNLFVGLIDALAARYPVCERLVGEEFFRAVARAHVVRERPRSPILLHCGDNFPDFIESFAPAEAVPYLADMARLEAARSSAYHAAEAVSLDIEAIASFRPDELIEARFTLHHSVRLVCSRYPIASIWLAHQGGDHVESPVHWEAEDVLVLRPEAEVLVHRLPVGGHGFVAALIAGSTLAEAGETGLSHSKEFDLGQNVAGLFAVGAIVDFVIGKD
jgi:hypothetical protein